jgi:membrane protein implicated in regulation of membrane protease activity
MIDKIELVWFSLIFFFLILEMGHPGLLYFVSFSCGALCSFVGTFYGVSVQSQLALFIAGTCTALLIVYVWIKEKKNQLQSSSHRSNLDALIGKKVIVFQSKQDGSIWQAKIAGQIWLVKSIHNQPLVASQQVVIIDIQGCHLRVDTVPHN